VGAVNYGLSAAARDEVEHREPPPFVRMEPVEEMPGADGEIHVDAESVRARLSERP
jgi:hypothetical protein